MLMGYSKRQHRHPGRMGRNPTEARHRARRHSSNMNSAPASTARHRNTKTGQGRHLATTQAGHRHPPGAPASGGRRARRGEGGEEPRPPPHATAARHAPQSQPTQTYRPTATHKTHPENSQRQPTRETNTPKVPAGRTEGGGRATGRRTGGRANTDR